MCQTKLFTVRTQSGRRLPDCDGVVTTSAAASVPASDPDPHQHFLDQLEAGPERTPQGIANAIARLISDGQIPVGQRLPTVRAVAKRLAVSPTTASDAWRILQSHGLIITERRRGSFVRGTRRDALEGRFWQVPVPPGTFAIDLSTGTPDPALLPPLGPVLTSISLTESVTSYLDEPVLPGLHDKLVARWPFEPDALTVVDGALDALDRLIGAVVQLGDTVLVEDPCFAPTLDMLDGAGAQIVGLPLDQEGISVDALAAAMERQPVMLILQPRAHNPTGINMSASRAAALAQVVDGHELLVVEDDHSGTAAGAPMHSLGRHIPAQVAHIHSFSKSHGPDLRLAALGGARRPIERVIQRRRLGPSWSSRLLQRILLHMLDDAETEAQVSTAATHYAERRRALQAELASLGVATATGTGINLWVPVPDEQTSLVALAANGIGAAPGRPFMVDTTNRGAHLRLSTSCLSTHQAHQVADALAPTLRR